MMKSSLTPCLLLVILTGCHVTVDRRTPWPPPVPPVEQPPRGEVLRPENGPLVFCNR